MPVLDGESGSDDAGADSDVEDIHELIEMMTQARVRRDVEVGNEDGDGA